MMEIKSKVDTSIWRYVNEKERWIDAEDQLKTADFVYNNTDIRDKVVFKYLIKPLIKRYESGERTSELYEKIMSIKM